QVLVYSPQAPTVELLDLLREAFPAIGPSSKVHLVSSSRSPEHWVFMKHWKELFPRAEIWAVPGPHRRFMGVEVDHDLEHGAIPLSLGGEIEVAVLKGIPIFQEAILFHKPTGVLMSADALLSMGHVWQGNEGGGAEARRGEGSQGKQVVPGDQYSHLIEAEETEQMSAELTAVMDEAVPDRGRHEGGKGKQLRWGLLRRVAGAMKMRPIAILPPLRTLMQLSRGN
ncbi:unnamed protein product, partial [Discosporangium mesarthrocarpum]